MDYTTKHYIMTGGSFVANEKTVVIRRDALTPDYTCQPHIPTKEAAMELTYSLCGDYLIPNLALEDTKEYHFGKYGRMRCAYLKNHRKRYINTRNALNPV